MPTNYLCASALATMLLAGSPGLALAQITGTTGTGTATVANDRGGSWLRGLVG